MISFLRRDLSFPILAATVGSTLGLLESTLWVASDLVQAIDPAIKLIFDGYFAYGLAATLLALPWWAFAVMRHWSREARNAAAVALPTAVFLAFGVLSRLPTETLAKASVSLSAAVAVGFVVYWPVRNLVLRFRFLGTVEVWLFAQSWFFLRIILLLTTRYETGLWKWPALAVALLPFGYFTRAKFLGSGRVHPGWLAGLCVSALAIIATLPFWPVRAEAAQRRTLPNVLLITIDTLRADHVGAYGYGKAQTPNLDRLADEGVLFSQAIAPATETCPSHTSILTGLYPAQHGTLFNEGVVHIDKRSVTAVPEILASRGYRTAAFVSGATLSDGICGLSFRFDLFDENFSGWKWTSKAALKLSLFKLAVNVAPAVMEQMNKVERPATQTTDQAVRWLRTRGDHPFFLWVHYFDPHEPYRPPGPFVPPWVDDVLARANGAWYGLPLTLREQIIRNPKQVDHMIGRYDGEIAYTDTQIGRLLREVESLGLEEDTLVVLTADHGEGLGEHNTYFDHVSNLYDENLRVPLILRYPNRIPEGKKVYRQVRLVDIAPTILDLFGVKDESFNTSGQSLLPLLGDQDRQPQRTAFAAIYPESEGGSREWGIYALRTETHKLIRTTPWWRRYRQFPEREELYELSFDFGEENDIISQSPPALLEMRRALDTFSSLRPSTQTQLSEEAKEQLRSLGYLD